MKQAVLWAGMALPVAFSAAAQGVGVTALGASGGLNIPSAQVLDEGEVAVSRGNEQDPRLGKFSKRQNYTLGFGLGGGVELFGRLVEYQNPASGLKLYAPDVRGPRDISANLKWVAPRFFPSLPQVAVGATDLSGGAVHFKSVYVVATDEYGPLRASLGVGKGKKAVSATNPDTKALNGVFGGVEMRVLDTRLTALAETDGTRRHIGARYYSEPLPWLADGQLIGTLQRSTAGQAGLSGLTSFNVSAVFPMDKSEGKRRSETKSLAKARPLSARAASEAALTGSSLQPLVDALQASGLERVRVGTLGQDLVVEYENHRYLQNEADALGVVLGLAAEMTPGRVGRVYAIALKSGQVVAEASVDAQGYRNWLRDEAEDGAVRRTFGFGRLAGYDARKVRWLSEAQVPQPVRVELKPLLNYTLGTEYGLFDYSLALQVRPGVDLWPGARLYADLVQPVVHSQNMDPAGPFASSRHRSGLKTLALQQNFWLDSNLFASVGAGVYQYKAWGAEGESIYFMPDSDDTVHLRGRSVKFTDNTTPSFQDAWSASYRWRATPVTWIEGSWNAYTDATRGVGVTMTRWFGDVALNLYVRKGGANTFAGLDLSIPLTPRDGVRPVGGIQFEGVPRYELGIRTLVAEGSNQFNWVRPDAVRPVDLIYKPDVNLFNSGRIRQEYMASQLPRMREAFYLYARGLLP